MRGLCIYIALPIRLITRIFIFCTSNCTPYYFIFRAKVLPDSNKSQYLRGFHLRQRRLHRGHVAPDATSFVWRWRVQACSFSVLTPVRPHAITSLPFALCHRSCAQCSVHASLSPCACRQCHTRHPLLAHYPSGCPKCRRPHGQRLSKSCSMERWSCMRL